MLDEELLKQQSQLNRSQYESNTADANTNESSATKYLGYDPELRLARLQDANGNIFYGKPDTNGAIANGEDIRLRRGYGIPGYDAMPHTIQPSSPESVKKKKVPRLAILYILTTIEDGEKHCTCSRWYLLNGWYQEKCRPPAPGIFKLNERGYGIGGFPTKEECIASSPIFSEIDIRLNSLYYYSTIEINGAEYNPETTTFNATEINISGSGGTNLATFNNTSVFFRTHIFTLEETSSVAFKASFVNPPNSELFSFTVSVNTIPASNSFPDYYLPGSTVLNHTIELSPGTYYLTLHYAATGGSFSSPTAPDDFPISGFAGFEILNIPPVTTTKMRSFYLSGNKNKPNYKILELREDDPYKVYLTQLKDDVLIAIKSGMEPEWCKIHIIKLKKGELEYEKLSSPNVPETRQNWQDTYINSYATEDPNSGSPCINKYKNNLDSNIVSRNGKTILFRCDLEQEVDGVLLKDLLITSATSPEIKTKHLEINDNSCAETEVRARNLPVASILLDETLKDVEDLEIIAISAYLP